jgi:ABC-type phosphate/phosphonate transport system substrate-binding protein
MITSFRMYNAGARAAAAWRALFAQVFRDAGVEIEVVEHGWPKPIDSLWNEPELCCAFMCGWPFARSTAGMQAIAAPVPSPQRYAGLPRYCSDFVVRAASGWTTLEETLGHRFGWMAENSHSGFNAPRAHLARLAATRGANLYAQVTGPLGTPATTLEALRDATVDVVALDGFYLDLLRHHEPAKWEGLRVVASTPWTPIPLLVAAPAVDAEAVSRLRATLVAVNRNPSYALLLREALVARFVSPELEGYGALEAMATFARHSGYTTIR